MKQFILKYLLSLSSRAWLVIALITGLSAIAASAFAYTTPIAGGKGGKYYSLDCQDSNRALVGIRGSAGSLIDKVRGVCAQINYDGTWQGTTTTTGSAGGSGGTSFNNLTCPSGYAVTGIKGKAGSYVDQLRVRCGQLGQNGRFSSLGDFLNSSAGGSGGSSFGPYDCNENKPAYMIRGYAGTWVDGIGLGCNYVNTLKVINVSVPAYPVRVSQTASVFVTMSLAPASSASVNLASSNSSIAPVSSSLTVGTRLTQGTVSTTPTAPGCTTITASYKGSSYSSSKMVVHSATSSRISLTTPTEMRIGTAATVTVTIPSPASTVSTITLTNLDPDLATMPSSIRIEQNAVSSGFQVTAGQTQGCVRIKASGNEGEVTHTIRVVR